MTRHNGEAGGEAAVGDRHAGIRGAGNGRGDARNNLVCDSRLGECHCLFPTTPEYKGVTTLQTHNGLDPTASVDQKSIDLALRGRLARPLSYIEHLGGRWGQSKKGLASQSVVDENLRPFEQLGPAKGDEVGCPGPGADEMDSHGGQSAPRHSKVDLPDRVCQDKVEFMSGAGSAVRAVEPHGGALGLAELVAIAQHWAPLVVGSATPSSHGEPRWYRRLEWNDQFEVWVLGWDHAQGTDFHDHGGSAGAVQVVEGTLIEARPTASGVRRRTVRRGHTLAFDGAAVHDVTNARHGPSLSVHVYSPPLTTMTYYDVEATSGAARPRQTVTVDSPESGAVDLTGLL